MTFGAVFPRVMRPAFGPGLAAAGAASWWLAGGATGAVAVYQPKGAASLAASYVNLANPGTYDAAPGVAPTLDANGWVFNGSTQYLSTDFIFAGGTILAAITGAATASAGRLLGATTDPNNRTEIVPHLSGYSWFFSGTYDAAIIAPGVVTGVLGMAGRTVYIDGVDSGTSGPIVGYSAYPLWIGTRNYEGVPSGFYDGKVVAIAIYNTTLTAPQVAAISTAMAAL